MEENRLLVLSGPTASGKTALALSLGLALPLEIINADSLQVYRGMDIGTAKPTLSERREVAHHLIDVADPDEEYNAGRFVAEAENAVRGIRARGKFPLVAGGTGMYIRALLRGLDALPSDAGVRVKLERRWKEEGGGTLFAELRSIDPASAEAIHPSDRVRVLRALEVAAIAGLPPSRLKRRWAEVGGKVRILFIGISLDRGEIYRRIDARGRHVPKGLSTRSAASSRTVRTGTQADEGAGIPASFPISPAACRCRGHRPDEGDTRRYAKRQMTWLAREPEAVWTGPGNAGKAAVEMARKFLF
jgi:tRNA dimethylallyltransferase